MKFFTDKKEDLSVINRKKKVRVAFFKNGEFETENPDVIRRLKPHFRCEESPKVISGLAGFLKLKEEAIEKGVYKKGMKKKDIEKILNLKEGEKNEE